MKEKNLNIYKKLHWLSLIIGLFTIVLPLIFWNKIPDRLPMHYNAAGIVDNWSDKSSLILLFFIIFILMGLMSICVYFVKSNIYSKYSTVTEKSSMKIVYPMLIIMNLIIQVMFAYITFCIATCRQLGIWFLPVFLTGVFAPLVVLIYRSSKLQTPSKINNAFFAELEKEQKGIIYRSKVDWWLGFLLLGTIVMMLWLCVDSFIKKGHIDLFLLGTSIAVSLIILPLFTIKYVMYDNHLLISMSIYGKVRIRYENIQKMTKTLNPLSSAALSLKRLQIDYVENDIHQMILISPKDRDNFVEEIEKRKKASGL